MTKLTPTQLAVLSSARNRDDGLVIRPAGLRAAAAAKLVASLSEKGFVKEIRARGDAPVWREDEDGRFALKVLKAGRAAVESQVGDEPSPNKPSKVDVTAVPAAAASRVGTDATARIPTASRPPVALESAPVALPAAAAEAQILAGSKRARVVALLRRPEGAAMVDLIAATGWLPHTTRAALSGLRKAGMVVELRKNDDLGTGVYRIVALDEQASAA